MNYFIRLGNSNLKEPITSKNIFPFNYEGVSLLAWEKSEKNWQVIEITTGLLIETTDNTTTKAKAISNAKSFIDKVGVKKVKDRIRDAFFKFNPPKITNVTVV